MTSLSKEELESLEASFGLIPHERLSNEVESLVARERLIECIATDDSFVSSCGGSYLDTDGLLTIAVAKNASGFEKEPISKAGNISGHFQAGRY
jgi:hypothetical protein